jgi:hypothetical protein
MDEEGFCIPKINNSYIFKNKMRLFAEEKKNKEEERRQPLLG